MIRSLVLHILWAPAMVLLLAVCAFALQGKLSEQRDQRENEADQARASILGSARLLTTRHARTVRRVRIAVHDSQLNDRVAVLNDTSQHYLRSMRSLSGETRRRLEQLAPRNVESATRMREQLGGLLDDIDTETALVAAAVEALRKTIEGEESAAFSPSLLEFERSEQAIAAKLSRLEATIRRLLAARAQAATSERLPDWSWAGLSVLALLSLVIATRRIRRIGRGRSAIEVRIRRDRERLQSELAALESGLSDNARAQELALQTLRRTEQELALFRIYNDNLVNSLRSAVVVTDLAGRVTGFNRAARTLLHPVLNQSIYSHPLGEKLQLDVTDWTSALERAVESDHPLRARNLGFHSEQSDRMIDVSVTAYLDEGGSARGLIWVVDDVTDAVQTKTRLLAAERLAAVGRLSAQVAHEIRNPLSAIGLNAELLEDELERVLEEPDEARALLRAIANEIERLTEVTEGYLQMTRLPQGQSQTIDLNASVRDLLSMIGPELRAHAVEVDLSFDHAPTTALVDPGQLRQALLNVLRNAREAMPDGGRIRIRTGFDGSDAVVEVEDEGPGIPAEVRARVFEPFYTTKKDGTGLGLSLTLQSIREQRGDVHLDETERGGTRVRILLPAPESESVLEAG
ncbi:MAG: ATP-binding protein [Myxococcota bacterium]